jgi:hypothetical protein
LTPPDAAWPAHPDRAGWWARNRWLRPALGALAVAVVLLGALLALRLLRVSSDLRDARDHITAAGDRLEDGHISAAREDLAAATRLLVRANADLYRGPDVAVLGVLPVVSQNLAALRESAALGLRLADGGHRSLAAAASLEGADGDLEVPLASGAIPLDAVTASQVELERLLAAMPASNPPKRSFLLGPVRDTRAEVYDEARSRRVQVATLSRGLSLLGEMAGATGPRRYLIAVANTAEMRGSGGMILSYGVLESRGGDFALAGFGRIDDLALAQPLSARSVPGLPADFQRRWDGFDPLSRWRNANLAADFTIVAPVLEEMYSTATGKAVDGVIQIDPDGLAAILAGIGPVQVPELGEVRADNVVALVLNEAYVRFPGIDERSDVLKEVAEAVFDKLVEGRYDSLRPLAEALVRTVEGRHIVMHTKALTPEARLRFFGATGDLPDALGPDSMHLSIQNVSGNKLDYYLDSSLLLTGDRDAGALGHLRATITLTNTAPPGATSPRYIFGPFNAAQRVGLYRGVVSLYLPAGTMLTGAAGDALPSPPVLQTEGGRPVVGFNVDVPAGATREVVLDLQLPPRAPGDHALLLVPSPRVRPTHVEVHVGGDAALEGSAVLDRTWRFRTGAGPEPVGPGGLPTVAAPAGPVATGRP